MMIAPHDDDAFVAAFLRQLLEDREAGREEAIEAYLERFSGHEGALRRAYAEVNGQASETHPEDHDSASGPGPEGRTLGPYRLLELVASGGQGEVYLARDTRLGRQVAVKILRGLGGGSRDAMSRFRREAELASRLDHPGICPVYDTGIEHGVPYIVMRYVEGTTLARRIDAWRPAPGGPDGPTARDPSSARRPPSARDGLPELLHLMEQAARAVHAAHEAGVLHRDLKPGNIMVALDDTPVILDFGLARMMEGEDSLHTITGELFGTPAYMAPEILRTPPEPADRRTDVYSLGVTLFEAVTGRRPFASATRDGLYQAILRDEPSEPRRINPAITEDLRIVILTALEKDRDRRYVTAVDLAEDLRRVREHLPIRARPAGPVLRFQRWVRRDPMRAALVVLLFLLVAAGGYGFARWPALQADLQAAEAQRHEDRLEGLLAEGFTQLTMKGAGAHARVLFREARELAPASVEPAVGEAFLDFAEKAYATALERIDGLPPEMRSHPAVTSLRHEALVRLGGAEPAAAPAAPTEPKSTALTLFVKAFVDDDHAVAGDAEAARRALARIQQCLAIAPRPRLIYHLAWARAATLAQDPGACRSASAALETLWPDNLTACESIVFTLYMADPPRAVTAGRKLVAARPGEGRLWYLLAQAQASMGAASEAEASARRATELAPRDPDAWFMLGWTRQGCGRPADAEAAYRTALSCDADCASAHHNLAILLQNRGEIEEAMAHLREATRIWPRHAGPWQILATCFVDRGDLPQAEEAARTSVRLDPAFPQARNTLGSVLVSLGRLDEGIAELREAVRLDPDYAVAMVNLARHLRKRGAIGEAIGLLRHAREIVARQPGLTAQPDDLLAECERQASVEGRLDDVLAGRSEPKDGQDGAELAGLAEGRQLWAAAAWLWRETLRYGPDPEDSSRARGRVRAAVAAARAGSAETAGALDPESRARWRQQAVAWLEEEFVALREDVAAGRARRSAAAHYLEVILDRTDFAPLRDGAMFATLPEAERERCRRFWTALRDQIDSWSEGP